MSHFFGVLRHEFKMAVKRPGMWIAYAVLYVFYSITVFAPSEVGEELPATTIEMWQHAAMIVFYTNMFMVLLGGILAADRLQRDYRLGIRELQRSSPIGQFTYLLAKYTGVWAAVISPMFIFVMGYAVFYVARGVSPLFLAIMPVVILVMGGTAFAFVVAFSIACPLFMPVRVYQVLFVGYWFWGNYLSPEVFPTIRKIPLVWLLSRVPWIFLKIRSTHHFNIAGDLEPSHLVCHHCHRAGDHNSDTAQSKSPRLGY